MNIDLEKRDELQSKIEIYSSRPKVMIHEFLQDENEQVENSMLRIRG
ncbi:MAG: hypothetical protein QRY74_05235 [Chlamydia sp.]